MRILLTGASGGIGSSILESLLMNPENIVVATYNKQVGPMSSRVEWICVDFTDAEETYKLFNSSLEFDVIIHAAGIANASLIGKQTLNEIQNQIQVNLVSALLLVEVFMPRMIKRRFGRIILMGSIVGRDGSIGLSTYASSKAGLHGLLQSATREMVLLKRKYNPDSNFTINIVSPGFTDTQMTADMPLEIKEGIVRRTAMGRFGAPNEVARVVLFLQEETSESINGTVIEVNGGCLL